MPLYKRKPFPLAEKPKDLKPHEQVFQVRFTKEIFRDYSDYLNRINQYRQRVWTCKVTGKSNLTYEEALVSEKKAAEKIEQIPKELIAPVLGEIQFSMLRLRDLANAIVEKLQGCLKEGSELYGRKDSRAYLCKIVEVLEDDEKTKYEVAWLDKDMKVTGNSLLDREDLIKKLPVTREVMKSFIKESTYRNLPWVLHDKLAKKHGISTDPPEELKGTISVQDGLVICNRKRKKAEDEQVAEGYKSKALEPGRNDHEENKKSKAHPIKYPIEDLLLDPAVDDQHLTERPLPCRDFNVPMDCVGDLLMVWNFCTSFGRLLNLSPFSLEDFEGALCHKESNVVLVVESHSALLRVLLKDNGGFSASIQNKKRRPKITLITWADYLCDFVEFIGISGLCGHITTIKRGHYGLLDVPVKLRILGELIAQALETDLFREKLDEYIEERQALAATKRGEAIEEGRKRREEKEQLKTESNEATGRDSTEAVGNNSDYHGNSGRQNGNVLKKLSEKNSISEQKHSSNNSGSDQADPTLKKNVKKPRADLKVSTENTNDSSRKKGQKLVKDDTKDKIEKMSKEQRKVYLEREIEKRFIRTNALGKDRHYTRYWFFRRDGRLFVENSDSTQWGYYSSKEELDAFMGSLNPKGERERALKKQLEKLFDKICSELEKRSKEIAQRIEMEEAVLRRSTRVRAPPRDNPALAFLKYENKWKED